MTQTNPTVSVVMAAHNEAEYIGEAINSILNQTYSDFEFIIIDDGSTDQTIDIIESFDDGRLYLLQNDTNRGLPASLNRGIKFADGKYIARMDADDRSTPKRLEKQVKVLEQHQDVHVVSCWKGMIDKNGKNLGVRRINNDVDWTEKWFRSHGPKIAHPSVMIRKRSLEGVGGYREEYIYAQDLDLWIRMANTYNSNFVYVIQEQLFQLRLTPDRYKKRPLQIKFTEHAGKQDLENIDFNQIVEETPDLPKSVQHNTYNYTVGRRLLIQGNRINAILKFLKAIKYKPNTVRPYYGLMLAFKFW